MFKFLKKIWRGGDKDPYLKYLKNSTGLEWVSAEYLGNEKSYICTIRDFYLERKDNGKVRCTRQAKTLPKQTPMGPFCEWFEVNEYDVHKYVK